MSVPVSVGRFGDTRERAVQLFARKGYNGVSMRELAASLGLSAGSLYNHIESKEALLIEFVEELYEALYSGALRVIRRSPASCLPRALVERHLALHESMPAHFVLLEKDLRHLPDQHRHRVEEGLRRYVALLARHCAIDLPSAFAFAALLNSAPAWLFGLSADVMQRTELACHFLLHIRRHRAVSPGSVDQ